MSDSILEFNIPLLLFYLIFFGILDMPMVLSTVLACSLAMNVMLFRNLQRMWNS